MSTTNQDDANDPLRVYAESCILHSIDQLHGEQEQRLREVDANVLRLGDQWLDEFLGTFSIPSTAVLEIVQQQWQAEKSNDPTLDAAEFARRWAGPVFSPWTPMS